MRNNKMIGISKTCPFHKRSSPSVRSCDDALAEDDDAGGGKVDRVNINGLRATWSHKFFFLTPDSSSNMLALRKSRALLNVVIFIIARRPVIVSFSFVKKGRKLKGWRWWCSFERRGRRRKPCYILFFLWIISFSFTTSPIINARISWFFSKWQQQTNHNMVIKIM